MNLVSRFEANLLTILDCFLGRCPLEQALPLMVSRAAQPDCLSRAAVELVQDRLAKGCMLRLARAGGWRRARHLRGDRLAEGRLWDRTPPAELGLSFTGQSLRFLIWITAHKPADDQPWSTDFEELTPSDLLLLYFAYGVLRQTDIAAAVRGIDAFDRNGLVRLAYPADFDLRQASLAPDFLPWTAGLGAAILEALQPELADRWVELEQSKKEIAQGRQLRDRGQSQLAVLERFLEAIESASRLDLGRFLLQSAARLLTPAASRDHWLHRQLDAGVTMVERQQTYEAALALVRQVERFQHWERRARAVGYFDEGYPAAQLCKADWEALDGDILAQRAQSILRQVPSLA